ncbi:MAG: phosphoribosylglycinamide formyltransferase [Clostridia bacterium]|nr:phosphoribosylglycinamide formyltransferase [Clostridia bacterium]
MKKAKIAVLVSGGGTNLQALLDAEKSGALHSGTIALVLSNKPNAYALVRAANAGVETVVVEKKDPATFEQRIAEELEKRSIDLVVLAGFMVILSKNFTDRYRERILNVHPSLIPSFCGEGFYGLKVHEAALKKGVKVTGATVHFVNEIPDGGRIVMQKAVEVKEGDTPEILQRRVMEEAEWKILPASCEIVSKKISEEKK